MPTPADVAERIKAGRLRTVLSAAAILGARRGHEIAQDAVGGSSTFDPDDPGVRRLLDDSAARITGIVEETRRRVAATIAAGVEQGLTIQEIAKALREDQNGAFKPWRAKLIARTESATIINGASVNGYRRSGLVEEVEVLDGKDCDWPEGHGGGTANGTIVSLSEAQKHLLAHPGCVRAFAPIIRAEDR